MRKNVLPITAGIFGSLALAVSASADFTGFKLINKGQYDTANAFGGPNVGLVDVWNLYLNFDDPNDRFNSVFVLANDPDFGDMQHSSDLVDKFDGKGNGFWNWQFGGNTPLDADGIYAVDPAAGSADTYLTIGLKAGTFAAGDDAALFPPGSEPVLIASGILNGSGIITEDFAFAAIPDAPQTHPDANGQVLVLQIAVLRGQHASGIWNIQWGNTDPKIPTQQARFQWTTVPAPGALALLGLAGLAGARRRRRS